MTISNCPHCGGTHYGSYVCPLLPDEIEKNKRAAEEGLWRKHRERERAALEPSPSPSGGEP